MRLTDAHLDFFNRIVVKPAFDDLRFGRPLPCVLAWVYCLGLVHGNQIAKAKEIAPAKETQL